MPISNVAKSIIGSISTTDVEKTLVGLDSFIMNSKWLGPRNWYANNTIQKIEHEFGSSIPNRGTLLQPKQMSQYIAASGIHHCTDGWNYLGKAIDALLRGSPHICRHLAYYAELRAVMSLLSMKGVGVFSNHHTFINGPNSSDFVPARIGTHAFVAECLELLGNQQIFNDPIFATVRPSGISLGDWLHPVGGIPAGAPLIKQWLSQWGMDLHMVNDDRNQRNESSYRPGGLPAHWEINSGEAIEFIQDFWNALEPSSSPFEEIDRHMLRNSLESIFFGQSGKHPQDDEVAFARFVKKVLLPHNLSAPSDEKWTKFLTRSEAPEDLCLFSYSTIPSDNLANGHLAIISRATLLLRLASGATASMLTNSGYSVDNFSFWWTELGKTRGLWADGAPPAHAGDLWADIQVLLEDIQLFQSNTDIDDQSFHRIGAELPGVMASIGSCERVAFWGAIPT